ncbi:gp26 family baseplate hub assembly chaperone [bacterium]|nr:gp26 family baseplate hub assembly chaperone [bacterium]
MALPKLSTPLYKVTLPVSKIELTFRPFLVKEEKIMLVGKEAGPKQQVLAMKQVLEAVVQEPAELVVGDLSMTDVEYLFLQLRARSVQNIVELKYRDKEDKKVYDFEIDLDDVQPTINPDHANTIMLNDTLGMELKDPTLNMMEDIDVENMEDSKNVFKLISKCTVKVWDENEVYDDFTDAEMEEFLGGMDATTFTKLKVFFDTAPKLKHELNYKNSEGNDRVIKLEGLSDFF